MLEKKEIRKKLLKIRKKNYFEISSRCFNPIIKFLKIGNKSYIAAGSVITSGVPSDSLAFGRSRQKIKKNRKKQ